MTTFDATTSTTAAGTPVVVASGELDVAAADDLVAVAQTALGEAKSLALDLSAISFMDSTGLSALLKVRELLTARGGALELRSTSVAVRRVLDLVGMAEVFGIDVQASE